MTRITRLMYAKYIHAPLHIMVHIFRTVKGIKFL